MNSYAHLFLYACRAVCYHHDYYCCCCCCCCWRWWCVFMLHCCRFLVDTSSWSRQLPTLVLFQNGKEQRRRPVIDSKGRVLAKFVFNMVSSNVSHSASHIRVPPGPYKSLKVLKFHTFKYKALKSP